MEEIDHIIVDSNSRRFSRRNSSKIIIKKSSFSAHQQSSNSFLPSIHVSPDINQIQQRNSIFKSMHNQPLLKHSKKITQIQQSNHKYKIIQLVYLYKQMSQDNVYYITKIIEQNKLFPQFQTNYHCLREIHRLKSEIINICDKQNQRIWKTSSGQILQIPKYEQISRKDITLQKQTCTEKSQQKKQISCQQQCICISVPLQQYQKIEQHFTFSQTMKKLLKFSYFFSKFNNKQLEDLLSEVKQKIYLNNDHIFTEGQIANQYENQKIDTSFYFIMNGQVQIQKQNKNKSNQNTRLCILGPGQIFGDEVLNEKEKRRSYTAIACSDKINVGQFQKKTVLNWLKKNNIASETYFKQINLQQRNITKKNHYKALLEGSKNVSERFEYKQKKHQLSLDKRNQFENKLKGIYNTANKISQLKRVQKKRMQSQHSTYFIDFKSPLFERKDFPMLEKQLKRFQNNQKIALKKLQLSKISVSRIR